VTLGKDVIVHTPDGEVPGKAQDIDENGALILVSGAESRTVNAGDCQHLD
jgi:biotin-(acetyl-CoA carboxylase) ligase